ncbi:MAG TPA: hypothetical protein VJM51_07000, partial [Dehalococcoidia bacterium]|nr:hypothetical protein [Dehalococcoidia bacterium]
SGQPFTMEITVRAPAPKKLHKRTLRVLIVRGASPSAVCERETERRLATFIRLERKKSPIHKPTNPIKVPNTGPTFLSLEVDRGSVSQAES